MKVGSGISLIAFCLVKAAFSQKDPLVHERRELGRRLADGGVLTEADKQALLTAHNDHRSATALGNTESQPMATDMHEMVWDEDLAVSSKAHADLCVFEHGQGSFGENLYAAGSTVDNVDNIDKLKAGIQEWFNEYEAYDYDGHQCSEVCGHYTQVVWASSTSMGCGYAECGPFPDNFYQVYLVCRYSPPGNYVGVRPYTLANNAAEIASECEPGFYSDSASGLCKVESESPIVSPTAVSPTAVSPTAVSPTAPTPTSSLSVFIATVTVDIKERNGKWKPTLKLRIEDTNNVRLRDVMISYEYRFGNKTVSKSCETNRSGLCNIKIKNLKSSFDSVTVVLNSVTAPNGNYNPELNFVENNCPVFSSDCPEYVITKP